jgi:hypothetical protein
MTTRLYRLLKIAKLYSTAVSKSEGYYTITPGDIFTIMKDIPNVMMLPNTYNVEMPSSNVVEPWGPSVSFQYTARPLRSSQDNRNYVDEMEDKTGNPRIIALVEQQLKTRLSDYIQHVLTKYVGDNTYTVVITQPKDSIYSNEEQKDNSKSNSWLVEPIDHDYGEPKKV